jgi:hypothetical protein
LGKFLQTKKSNPKNSNFKRATLFENGVFARLTSRDLSNFSAEKYATPFSNMVVSQFVFLRI